MSTADSTTQSSTVALLSADQRDLWRRDGYLHLRRVLSDEQIGLLLRGVDETVAEFYRLPKDQQAAHLGATGTVASDDIRLRNAVSLSAFMDELLDLPAVFAPALALLGPYIQVCGTEILLRRPYPDDALALHVDGGSGLGRMLPNFASNISHVKALYFLTDVQGRDRGNVILVPGSHEVEFPRDHETLASHPLRRRAFQLQALAGDVILFPATLWHAVAPNRSHVARTSLVVWYSQLWARPVDYDRIERKVLARLTKRQRLLLGELAQTRPVTYYLPTQADYLPTMAAGLPTHSTELLPYFDDYDSHRQDEETGR